MTHMERLNPNTETTFVKYFHLVVGDHSIQRDSEESWTERPFNTPTNPGRLILSVSAGTTCEIIMRTHTPQL